MPEDSKSRREIVLITRSENRDNDRWRKIETISRVLSIAAIPVVLAGGSWYIQKELQNQTVGKDYVQLAVSILRDPDTSKVPPQLRAWAVDLLNENSPTKFSDEVSKQLKSGNIVLPSDLITRTQSSLKLLETYLLRVGFKSELGEIKIKFIPGDSINREGQEFASLYDSTTNTIEIASAYQEDMDLAMHEYMRRVLSPPNKDVPDTRTRSELWVYYAIDSALADYYPCSFKNDPVLASKSGLSINLVNRITFAEASLDQIFTDTKPELVWGGAFWELRQLLGQDKADKLLYLAWTSWSPSDPHSNVSADFVKRIIEADRAEGGQNSSQIQPIFKRRGLEL